MWKDNSLLCALLIWTWCLWHFNKIYLSQCSKHHHCSGPALLSLVEIDIYFLLQNISSAHFKFVLITQTYIQSGINLDYHYNNLLTTMKFSSLPNQSWFFFFFTLPNPHFLSKDWLMSYFQRSAPPLLVLGLTFVCSSSLTPFSAFSIYFSLKEKEMHKLPALSMHISLTESWRLYSSTPWKNDE